jgi:hypothetical protein
MAENEKQVMAAAALMIGANDLLTTAEAAGVLNVKRATLEQWRWNGKGPRFVKLNRTVRYRRHDLGDFTDARTFGSTTEAQAAA